MGIDNGVLALTPVGVIVAANEPVPSFLSRLGRRFRTRPSKPAAAAILQSGKEGDGRRKEATHQTAQTSILQGKRALICEDEGISQMQLRRALSRAGLVVVGTAPNGVVAVEIAERERPDLVLMDIRMPLMDGIEATRRITSKAKTCVVMLTAFADEEHQGECAAAGASGYIVKPVTGETLVPDLEKIWKAYSEAN